MNKNERESIVDIGEKPLVERRAIATGLLHLSQASVSAIQSGEVAKGDVQEASTIAAIQAVKITPPSSHTVTQFPSKVAK